MTEWTRRKFLAGTAGILAASASFVRNAGASSVEAKFSLDRFIEDVKKAGRETDGQKAVESVLARAVSEPRGTMRSHREFTVVDLRRSRHVDGTGRRWPPVATPAQ